jgi:hypothetical protein
MLVYQYGLHHVEETRACPISHGAFPSLRLRLQGRRAPFAEVDTEHDLECTASCEMVGVF